jgi:hypothetical protein
MPNEFIIKNGFRSQGNSEITGSLNVLNGATIFNNLTINTSNLPVLNLFDSLQSHTWQFRSNGTSLFFLDNGTTRMWIGGVGSGNGGKIGINVTNTTAQLTIRGSGATSGTTALLVQNSNASASLVVNDNGAVAIGQSTPFSFAGSNSLTVNGIVYTSTAGGVSTPAIYIGDSGAGAGRGFYGVEQGIAVTTNNNTSMYFRGSSNLGSSDYPRIGINVNPTSVLDIRSDFTSSNLLNVSSSIGTAMFISGSGNVGIGIGNPQQKLSILGNNVIMFTGVSAQNMPAYIGTGADDNFYVYSAGQGSGKTSFFGPSNGTHIRTIANFLDLYVGNGAPILGIRLNSTGNILIGTTTDAGYKLDVNGSTRIIGQFQLRDTGGNNGFRSSGLYSAFGYNTNEENNVALKVSFGTGTSINTLLKVDNTPNSTSAGPTTVLLDLLANSSQTANLLQWRNSAGTILGVINNIGNLGIGTPTPASRLSVSGSAGTGSAIYAYKSGSTVLDIQGSQGQLFSVVDALSGSLMSVNDVSGLPILEVFSDDRVVMGTYGAPALTVSGSAVTVATASAAPTGTVPEGTFRFATVGGAYFIYAYLGGAWRSGSLF